MSSAAATRESMIQAGELIQQRVAEYCSRARNLFYAVMLFQRECPSCGSSALVMKQDSCCQCHCCHAEFDPTVQFQTCPDCDHALILKVYHYWCPHCRRPVRSMFCFDERVFNNEYFREMMQESRERKKEEAEKLRSQLLESRSPTFWPDSEPVIEGAAQFAQDLEQFTAPLIAVKSKARPVRASFDLNAYRHHILTRVQGCVVEFEGIARLVEDPQLDRVYRFITAIFLDHEGLLEIEQQHDGRITLVGA